MYLCGRCEYVEGLIEGTEVLLEPVRIGEAQRHPTPRQKQFVGTRVYYGRDCNPEQWSEDVWREEVRLMQEGGVSLVSLGVFSWAFLEPRPGQFEFSWLDRVMDLLHEHGVSINLATATASPPPWLAHNHPETLPLSIAEAAGPAHAFPKTSVKLT